MLACCVGIVCRNMSYLNMSCHDLEYRTYLVRNRARFVEAETRVDRAGETTSYLCTYGRYM